MEYIHLVGAEQVQSAANTIRNAADEMNRAASSIQMAIEEQRRILDNFIIELRDTMKGGY